MIIENNIKLEDDSYIRKQANEGLLWVDIEFIMLHYEDHLNALLGFYGDEIMNSLLELRNILRIQMPDWRKNPEEKAKIDSKIFIKYLELMKISF